MARILLVSSLLVASAACAAGMMGHDGMSGESSRSDRESSRHVDKEMREGFELTRSYCSRCHIQPDPRQHVTREWPQVVVRMDGYMRSRGWGMPSDAEQKLIIGYLEKNAADAR